MVLFVAITFFQFFSDRALWYSSNSTAIIFRGFVCHLCNNAFSFCRMDLLLNSMNTIWFKIKPEGTVKLNILAMYFDFDGLACALLFDLQDFFNTLKLLSSSSRFTSLLGLTVSHSHWDSTR